VSQIRLPEVCRCCLVPPVYCQKIYKWLKPLSDGNRREEPDSSDEEETKEFPPEELKRARTKKNQNEE